MSLALLLAGGAAWAAAGDLDPTFGGGDGRVVSDLGCESSVADLATVPGSGKIVAFGRCTKDDPGSALARYNPDGSLDPTFGGGDGVVVFGTLENDDVLNTFDVTGENLAVQPDGGVLVGGRARSYGTDEPEFAVTRFLPDGTLDRSFGGGDGIAVIEFEKEAKEQVSHVALQGTKIVAAGYAYLRGEYYKAALARFLPNGTPDKNFGGGDAKATANLSPGFSGVRDLAVVPTSGSLMVASNRSVPDGRRYNDDFSLARFRPNGALDKSFGGGDGVAVRDFGRDTISSPSAIVPGGSRTVVAGYFFTRNSPTRFALAAYARDGSPDRSFGGGDGKVTTTFGAESVGTEGAYAEDLVATQDDGKLLAVGELYRDGNDGFSFALARYNSDGSLDPTFGGGDGRLTTDFPSRLSAAARAVTIDDAGRAVVGGYATEPKPGSIYDTEDFALARYLLE